ncbi:MAG: hypothetical protein H0W90_04115 [Actinobacteria bacterium]|nr:hypothetical protein [Actinomycetota bacterium]
MSTLELAPLQDQLSDELGNLIGDAYGYYIDFVAEAPYVLKQSPEVQAGFYARLNDFSHIVVTNLARGSVTMELLMRESAAEPDEEAVLSQVLSVAGLLSVGFSFLLNVQSAADFQEKLTRLPAPARIWQRMNKEPVRRWLELHGAGELAPPAA